MRRYMIIIRRRRHRFSFILMSYEIMKIFITVKDCRDTRLTLKKMIQQNYGSTLTENNPLDV
jgi:hypothetical protein